MTDTLNNCDDCGKNVFADISDYFMLKDELWHSLTKGNTGLLLCKKCTEKRLGRPLKRSDFKLRWTYFNGQAVCIKQMPDGNQAPRLL